MKKMCVCFCWVLIFTDSYGQVVLNETASAFIIDFSAGMPVTAGNGTPFSAAGFEPDPVVPGRLNSNAWAITGWSDGILPFGGIRVTASTDYTRGTASNAISTGGIYAYISTPASVADPIFLIQPGSADWAPGTVTLKIKNGGNTTLHSLQINYNLYVRNDQGRSNSFNFSHSPDDVNYVAVPSLDYVSPAGADAFGLVLVGSAPSRSLLINGLNIIPGSYYYLRWSGADAGGSGSRDEFGLDNIQVSAGFAQAPLPVSLIHFSGANTGSGILLKWITASEQNNLGFEVQRSCDAIHFESRGFVATQAILGNSQTLLNYSFRDTIHSCADYFFRLKQTDIDWRTSFSNVIKILAGSALQKNNLKVFPNPFRDHFQVDLNIRFPGIFILRFTDQMGREIHKKLLRLNNGRYQLKIESADWPPGVYLLEIIDGQRRILRFANAIKMG